MTKKVVSFSRKNRVTPSVAAPGDTNPSDATDVDQLLSKTLSLPIVCDYHLNLKEDRWGCIRLFVGDDNSRN